MQASILGSVSPFQVLIVVLTTSPNDSFWGLFSFPGLVNLYPEC